MSLHAQSLNPDTLKKYHISEILTYKVDSAGKKVLQGTRIINDKGRTNELTTRSETYLDSVLYLISYDTFKYYYDLNDRIINELHTAKVINFSNKEQGTKNYSWKNKTIYKKTFIIKPFSKQNISYIHYKKNEEIIKRYSNGKRIGYFKYSSDSVHKYSVEKYYKRHYHRNSAKNKDYPYKRQRSRHKPIFYRKLIIHTTSVLNLYSDIIQENISEKAYYNKPLPYSYIKTYQYLYEDSLIKTCKTTQPYFVTRTKTKNETKKNKYKIHNKRIRYVEEKGILVEVEIYEYIKNPL